MKNNKKGFTLAELLIVVAIIAVLVGISIPVFTSQLEKAREAVDAANIRAKYAELAVKVLESEGAQTEEVTLTQTKTGWQNTAEGSSFVVAGIDIKSTTATKSTTKGSKVVIAVATDGTVTIKDKE